MREVTVCGDCHWWNGVNDGIVRMGDCCVDPPRQKEGRAEVFRRERGCDRFEVAEGKQNARWRTIAQVETAWEQWIDIYCFQLIMVIRGLEKASSTVTVDRGQDRPPLNMLEHMRDMVAKQQGLKRHS